MVGWVGTSTNNPLKTNATQQASHWPTSRKVQNLGTRYAITKGTPNPSNTLIQHVAAFESRVFEEVIKLEWSHWDILSPWAWSEFKRREWDRSQGKA